MMKVKYVVVREDLNGSLIRSQVLDVICEVNNSDRDMAVDLVWFYRIDYLFRRNSISIKQLKKELESKNINSYFFPFLGGRFPLVWWQLPIVAVQWLIPLIYLCLVSRVDLFHCRSYHSAIIGFMANCFFKKKYIFDPRSPMPEENIVSGKWSRKCISFILWKYIEEKIISKSDKTLIIGNEFKGFYRKKFDEEKFVEIPNNYPASFDVRFCDKSKAVESIDYDFVYVGSFGHWNQASEYLVFLKKINEISIRKLKMLFIVREDGGRSVYKEAERIGVDMDLFEVKSLPQNEVIDALERCLMGVYLMKSEDPRLGVKTVEYLRAGLPVVVSNTIKGASSVIQRETLGVVWDYSDKGLEAVHQFYNFFVANKEVLQLRCKNYAIDQFSPKIVSMRLMSECYSSKNF